MSSIDLLRDVELNVKIELGRSRMMVEDVLKLAEGSVVELDKLAGDPVDVFVNDRLVARGEVLVLNDNFCVRVNEIVAGGERRGAVTAHARPKNLGSPRRGAVRAGRGVPALRGALPRAGRDGGRASQHARRRRWQTSRSEPIRRSKPAAEASQRARRRSAATRRRRGNGAAAPAATAWLRPAAARRGAGGRRRADPAAPLGRPAVLRRGGRGALDARGAGVVALAAVAQAAARAAPRRPAAAGRRRRRGADEHAQRDHRPRRGRRAARPGAGRPRRPRRQDFGSLFGRMRGKFGEADQQDDGTRPAAPSSTDGGAAAAVRRGS